MRPSGSYAHEKEVRIVFRVIAARDISGLKVNVEPNALLKGGEVVISPFVAPDEADAIIEVARGLLKEPAIRFRQSEEWRTSPNLSRELVDELVRAVGPFSKEEDLPALLQKL